MRHLFLGRRNYIKPSRPGFKTTTKGKFSVGYTRLKNGNPKFFHFPNFHWYFYEMHQIVIERNREAWIGFLLLFGHWIHFIDFISIFYLIQIASFVRWGLFSSPFFVIFFLRNEQTLECNFKYCETFAEFAFSISYEKDYFFWIIVFFQINDPFFPLNKHIRRPYLLLTSLGPDIDWSNALDEA